MKLIEITVDPRGQTKVETRGFAGGTCRQASKFINRPWASPAPRR